SAPSPFMFKRRASSSSLSPSSSSVSLFLPSRAQLLRSIRTRRFISPGPAISRARCSSRCLSHSSSAAAVEGVQQQSQYQYQYQQYQQYQQQQIPYKVERRSSKSATDPGATFWDIDR